MLTLLRSSGQRVFYTIQPAEQKSLSHGTEVGGKYRPIQNSFGTLSNNIITSGGL